MKKFAKPSKIHGFNGAIQHTFLNPSQRVISKTNLHFY